MIKEKSVTAVIVAAGNSVRFGQNCNKNFVHINEKPIVLYSLEAFNEHEQINEIFLVVKKEELEIAKEVIEKIQPKKEIRLIIGGKTRKESVYNGIKESNAEIVIIHDAARPMIQQNYITKSLQAMEEIKGTSIAVKSKDTIKITDQKGIVIETTDRACTWLIQTPQCFHRKILLAAHEKYKEDDSITDDCMLLEKEKQPIKLIEGDYSNIKITTYDDLALIDSYMDSFEKGNL